METLDFHETFLFCDLKIGLYRQFTVLIKIFEYSRSSLLFALTNMALAKGHLSKFKSQVC